ncbi:SDR family oxidoreductase [Luteipulveratus mongoliensis]|uniref:Short-chain dehydrogenase n=1 Tax=Luteipulveratus mongoliensis TaxID=571913 RepID=A0A0K1JFB5_9MICO|nr:NAD(P)-dependent oxidoreductase [Luteipulveratus mongoliensis]AKU15396.1 short-chain dehydrogenase [Luteipulveratus mongoliensis]
MKSLQGRTILMSGGSRGIGLAIALRAARDGANVAILAKTDQPHPKLEGTIHTAADEIRKAGGQALPVLGDVRNDEQVQAAVDQTVAEFGGIDIVVNNASAIDLSKTPDLAMKKYDLMQDINCRGSFLLSKTALPHLQKSSNAHILTLSPPLNLDPKWAGGHLGYTIAKYGMSLTTLGLAEELKDRGISVNSLWPRTMIATAAVLNLLGGEQVMATSRKPEIVADAAYAILTKPPREVTGQFLIDDEVLAAEGVTDLSSYATGDGELAPDIFLD